MVLFLKTREIPSRREDFHLACGNVAPSSVRLYFPLTRFSSSFANIGCKFLKIICFWREFFSAFNLCAFLDVNLGKTLANFCEKIEKMGNIGLIFLLLCRMIISSADCVFCNLEIGSLFEKSVPATRFNLVEGFAARRPRP